MARLRHLLPDLDDVIYAFRLTCAEKEMERRIATRNTAQVDWELERFKELIRIQESNAARGDLGYAIDTTNLNIAQVADAIWKNIHEAVELAPYDPAWAAQYKAEADRLCAALGDWLVEIHHIGSTAVPGLAAKPVIDILVSVRRLEDALACVASLQSLGYTFIDYPQNTDRRFFRKGLPRTHHLHIVEQGSDTMIDHLAFCAALRTDADLRRQYAQLKADLAARHKSDRAAYSASKTTFVQKAIKSRIP